MTLPAPQPTEERPEERAHRFRIAELEARLREAEETLEAIRSGAVDAVVVGNEGAPQVYTIDSADRPYRVLIEQMGEGAVTLAPDGTVLYCNRCLAEMLGLPQERVTGSSMLRHVREEDRATLERLLARHGKGELALLSAAGPPVPVQVSFTDLVDRGARVRCGIVTNLSEQRRRMIELSDTNRRLGLEIEERARAEDMLRQSQKMEAVGQLTGGLAHDFNNLLAGISGSLELMGTRIAQGRMGDVDRYLGAARDAARRAAALTHRLLAFSRRQTLAPKVTDVGALVAGMEELLHRTVGPQVTVRCLQAEGLWPVEVDPNQLEMALLNLCINARDAMPDGGTITVAAANRDLDEQGARRRDLPPGPYVALRVSDTGTGMAPEVVARAFDPFFTTKPIGVGTGLGLSMVYGFARQSGGQARIRSQVGQGTTVSVYLPRHLRMAGMAEASPAAPPAGVATAARGETVLIIDDEALVRMLLVDALTELGYAALEASNGPEGLRILRSTPRVDLLVTDVGLPGGLNGRQVADAARVLRPSLPVLFITGYAETSILNDGHLEAGMEVMTKPFGVEEMGRRVRAILSEG